MGSAPVVVLLVLPLDHRSGEGVNLEVVLVAVLQQLRLIDHAVVVVKVNLLQRGAGELGQSDLHGLLQTDIGLVAGLAGDGHAAGVRLLGLEQQVQVVDRQPRQGLKGQGGVGVQNSLNQRRLARRDAVGLRLAGQGLVSGGDGLSHHRGVQRFSRQQAADVRHQTLLKGLGLGGVLVGHGDQDGIFQLVNVSVLHHGANQRVDRHVEPGAP